MHILTYMYTYRSSRGAFITAFCGILSRLGGAFQLAGAAHGAIIGNGTTMHTAIHAARASYTHTYTREGKRATGYVLNISRSIVPRLAITRVGARARERERLTVCFITSNWRRVFNRARESTSKALYNREKNNNNFPACSRCCCYCRCAPELRRVGEVCDAARGQSRCMICICDMCYYGIYIS